MTFPTPHTVTVLAYQGGTEDDYGNAPEGWAAGVDQLVYAWAPTGSLEVNGWRHAVEADLTVYAPPDFTVGSRDRMVVDGDTYNVEGDPEDYNHGPFGFTPGVVVNLKRVSES